MKRCPKCRRDYRDETLNFCLDDGTLLLEGPGSGEHPTAILNSVTPDSSEIDKPTVVKPPASAEISREQLLLADFENTTGEAIFDQTLEMALAFALAQSPFLKIVPENKVAHSLRLMKHPPDERVTRKLAFEICQRQGLKAFITGSISSFGSVYVLMLEAFNARTSESIGRQFEKLNSKEEVLAALSRAATRLRENLGESLSSIEKYDVPFDVTTSSLEALKFYTLGRQQDSLSKWYEAVPFYKKALELDPNFATAYAGLAVVYYNIRMRKLAAECAAKAYNLLETVSENEKLRISYFYHQFVTGEINKAIDALELWRRTYPSEMSAYGNLGNCLGQIGQFEKAAQATRDGLKLQPNPPVLLSNLAVYLLSLNRYEEAKETCLEAIEKKVDDSNTHRSLYYLGAIEGDEAAMAEQIAWFGGRPEEHRALFLQASVAGFGGARHWAQDFSRRAVELAKHSDDKENAALYAAEQDLRIVFFSSGKGLPTGEEAQLKALLREGANYPLKLSDGRETMNRAALALAFAGHTKEAEVLIEKLKGERPADTLNNQLWFPTIRAASKLQEGEAREALDELGIAERYERAGEFYPQYIRGLAYLKLDQKNDAVREFDKILNHRGEAPLSFIYPLAQLCKARATKDTAEYEKFFELWKDADADMPALVAAKTEFAALD